MSSTDDSGMAIRELAADLMRQRDVHLAEINRLQLERDLDRQALATGAINIGNQAREIEQLKADIARWEALGEKHDIKLRDDGCKCDREEGDSLCPVHGDPEEQSNG